MRVFQKATQHYNLYEVMKFDHKTDQLETIFGSRADDSDLILTEQPSLDLEVVDFCQSTLHSNTSLQAFIQSVAHHNFCDLLTGLATRQKFVAALRQSATKQSFIKKQRSQIVIHIDIDHFKVVSSTYGHLAGNQLLCQVAEILEAQFEHVGLLARLGDDAFGVLVDDCSLEQATLMAEALQACFQNFYFRWQSDVFSVGVNIGIATVDSACVPVSKVMTRASAACYVAECSGSNRIQVYSENDSNVVQLSNDVRWINLINRALAEDLFFLYYQEIQPAQRSKRPIREILLRLPDETTGEIVSPREFLPAAERYHLMTKIDCWVIRRCFELIHKITDINTLYSINLSGDTLNNSGFVTFVTDLVEAFAIDPKQICFEITETVAITNIHQVSRVVSQLKALGFFFALDDFGKGSSSFDYLKNLPVDYLKVDGSLVTDVLADNIARTILQSINDIGHAMGLNTVAEYVASLELIDAVKSIGFDYMQGFEIAEPRPFFKR